MDIHFRFHQKFIFNKRRAIIGMLFFWGVLGLAIFSDYIPNFPKIFYWNATASIPRGLYFRIPVDSYEDGDIVVYHPSKDVLELAINRGWMPEEAAEGLTFIKRIGAVAGESYMVDEKNRQFWANGTYIGQASAYDSINRKMPLEVGEHVVPPGYFLPVAENPMSFDGRYSGTEPLESIVCRVVPLFTEIYW